jgi:hypothetical protein
MRQSGLWLGQCFRWKGNCLYIVYFFILHCHAFVGNKSRFRNGGGKRKESPGNKPNFWKKVCANTKLVGENNSLGVGLVPWKKNIKSNYAIKEKKLGPWGKEVQQANNFLLVRNDKLTYVKEINFLGGKIPCMKIKLLAGKWSCPLPGTFCRSSWPLPSSSDQTRRTRCHILLKGQCHEIFDPRFFSSKHPSWAPDYGAKAFSNINSNLRRYSNF